MVCGILGILVGAVGARAGTPPYVIVDTMQDACYNDDTSIPAPRAGEPYFGQDAQHTGTQASYRDNGDGTVSDLRTGLMWSKAVDQQKMSLIEAEAAAAAMKLAGHRDWRVPTIKELYSLIDFRGVTGFGGILMTEIPRDSVPYIDTRHFDFRYGLIDQGERFIDAQWLSRTRYVSKTMRGSDTLFGVNFADGRIKGYGYQRPGGGEKKFYVRYVRGATYGINDFVDRGDGTVLDRATGLMWAKADSGRGMTWKDALAYVESFRLAGHDDWRLPNAKELQSIVDYTRSPDTSDSPAIDALFETTPITNEAGQKDWPYFWTSTTHMDGPGMRHAVYVSFGRALGKMHGQIMDVHGAGSQRSDPKYGPPRIGHGPQGDAQRSRNYVRPVRDVAQP